jgi:D-tyrosyl-tRNA(Tyr) deacylase
MKKAVYFFCIDENTDPVAPRVFNYIQKTQKLSETGVIIDGFPVLELVNTHKFHFVRTKKLINPHYAEYLPILEAYFQDYDLAGFVNWHEGANAPDKILTAHSIGDVPSGFFGKTSPGYYKNLITSLERQRVKHGLDGFRVMTEATHWSGIPYGQAPGLIGQYRVPAYDIEIGSTPESWNDDRAAVVLACALWDEGVFKEETALKAILCVGGIHFEESFLDIMLNEACPIGIGHILANHWIMDHYLDERGLEKLEACIESIAGGIKGIIFHDNLKGIYKQQCKSVAEKYHLYAGKHRILKAPEELFNLLG